MEKQFAYYIILGLGIGAVFGMGVGAAIGNPIWGIGIGALVGVYIGWFIAAAVQRNATR